MVYAVNAGVASEGMVGSVAGFIMLAVVIAIAFAVPPVRAALVTYYRSFVGYFHPPPQVITKITEPQTSDVEQVPSANKATRASDEDKYDFDLSLLAPPNREDTDTNKI